MRTFKEISEDIQKQITEFLEAADAKESVLDKTILEMKKRIGAAKERVALTIVEEQRLKRAYQDAMAAAARWQEKGSASSEAAQGRQQCLDRAAEYKRQLERQTAIVNQLKTALREFHRQFQSTLKRAEGLQQRQHQAETRTELYQLLFDDISSEVANALAGAERKLKAAETEARLWEEQGKKTGGTANLDDALAALKDDVLGSGRKK